MTKRPNPLESLRRRGVTPLLIRSTWTGRTTHIGHETARGWEMICGQRFDLAEPIEGELDHVRCKKCKVYLSQ